MAEELKHYRIEPDLADEWLTWQCKMIAGFIRGSVYMTNEKGELDECTATCPRGIEGDGESQLKDAARQALFDNSSVLLADQAYGENAQKSCDLIACRFLVDDKLIAVASVMVSSRSDSQRHAVLRMLRWGGMWMGSLIQQTLLMNRFPTHQEQNGFSLNLAKNILKRPSSHMAAMDMVNQLADQFSCERVSIGFRQGLTIRLLALSHLASFDSRTQLVRRVEAAMEEAVDQRCTMVYPGEAEQASLVTRAHVELSEQPGGGAVCTVPLPGRSGLIGAVVLERSARRAFAREEVAECESLVRVSGPVLDLKLLNERSWYAKGVESMLDAAAGVIGSAYLKLKVLTLVLLAFILILSFVDGRYEVTAQAGIEGSVRQILVAPQNGYVKKAMVQAGNRVKKGQIMAQLDDRSLQLERLKWQSERNKVEKQYQQALAEHDRIELGILGAQIAQVDAELLLVETQLEHTQLRAPFDGMVVSGDLSQSLGAPVDVGQVLFEVALLDSYRVALEIDDNDIAGINKGKHGKLIIAALPQSAIAITVDQVIPIAVSSGVRNYFRVEASLDERADLLLPGMRGIAKIDLGERKLLWIWTHALTERIRFWLLSMGW